MTMEWRTLPAVSEDVGDPCVLSLYGIRLAQVKFIGEVLPKSVNGAPEIVALHRNFLDGFDLVNQAVSDSDQRYVKTGEPMREAYTRTKLCDFPTNLSTWRSASFNEPMQRPDGSRGILWSAISDELFSEDPKKIDHDLLKALNEISTAKAVFTTADRYMGMASQIVEPGDQIWILFCSRFPVILRRTTCDKFQFVCLCYVDGVMNGELFGSKTRPLNYYSEGRKISSSAVEEQD
jgi:hypothetical protein